VSVRFLNISKKLSVSTAIDGSSLDIEPPPAYKHGTGQDDVLMAIPVEAFKKHDIKSRP
jgi:hypothetical protein